MGIETNTAAHVYVAAQNAASFCPTVPGWMAPAVIVAATGTLITIINSLRTNAKEKRENIITPILDDFSARVSTPVIGALQEIESVATDCSVGFRQFRTSNDSETTTRRSEFAGKFQTETLEPVRLRMIAALERADAYKTPASGRRWADLQDDLDPLMDIMNELQNKTVNMDVDQLDRLTRRFETTINNFSTRVNEELSDTKNSILNMCKLRFFGMYAPKK